MSPSTRCTSCGAAFGEECARSCPRTRTAFGSINNAPARGVSSGREADIRRTLSKALHDIDRYREPSSDTAAFVFALRDAVALVDQARAEACDLAGRPFAQQVGPLRRVRDALLVAAQPLTCGPEDEPTTRLEKAVVSLDDAIDMWAAARPNVEGEVFRQTFAKFQQEVWAAMVAEAGPLHAAVKAAGACTCPAKVEPSTPGCEASDCSGCPTCEPTEVEAAPPTPRTAGDDS